MAKELDTLELKKQLGPDAKAIFAAYDAILPQLNETNSTAAGEYWTHIVKSPFY
jgi:hypothetical protein